MCMRFWGDCQMRFRVKGVSWGLVVNGLPGVPSQWVVCERPGRWRAGGSSAGVYRVCGLRSDACGQRLCNSLQREKPPTGLGGARERRFDEGRCIAPRYKVDNKRREVGCRRSGSLFNLQDRRGNKPCFMLRSGRVKRSQARPASFHFYPG